MIDTLRQIQRTHYCGQLRLSDVGARALLAGWVDRRRDLGQLIFIDLRDRTGIIQVVFKADHAPEAHAKAEKLGPEYVIAVEGQVVAREAQTVNPNLATGQVELLADKLYILNQSLVPPFPLTDNARASEELRLEYRYLDLRRPSMQRNFKLRHDITLRIRNYLDSLGFLEIETPFLTKSTPEGARDYLVPSRIYPGKFYALPQSPQLFKQILMIAGFDRYFQIVRCFRDEDLRADRQPEFTQVDLEMAFPQRETIMSVTEGIIAEAASAAGIKIERPFPRLTYDEAIERYGTDKPDIRFGMELVDLSELFATSDVGYLKQAIASGGRAKAIAVKGGARYSRRELDELAERAKEAGAAGLVWIKLEAGEAKSSLPKSLSQEFLTEAARRAGAETGDLALIVAGPSKTVSDTLSALRLLIARREGLISADKYNLLWVTDFPLLEWSEEEKRWVSMHHPFTSPVEEDLEKLESDPGSVKAQAYDLVLNGYEIGGGSIRIHSPELQARVFRILGISREEAEAKFGFFLRALQYGTPPHGGIALGLDRIVMILAGERSLREVIAFPKTASATDLMTGSPSEVSPAQLAELKLKVTP